MSKSRGIKKRATFGILVSVLVMLALVAGTWSIALAAPPAQTPVPPTATPTPTPIPTESANLTTAGGTLTFGKGAVVLKALDQTVTSTVEVRYTPSTAAKPPAPAPTGRAFGSQIFSLEVYKDGKLQSDFKYSRLVEMTIKYTAADVDAALNKNLNQIDLRIWDAAFKQWIAIPFVRDQVGLAFISNQEGVGTYAITLQPGTPTPTPTPLVTPTPTRPAATPRPPTPTAVVPRAGDVAPGSGMLMGFMVGALVLVLGGGYLLVRSSRKSKA